MASKAVASFDTSSFLFLNEPDMCGYNSACISCNVALGQKCTDDIPAAVTLWNSYMAHQPGQLGTPAVSNAPSGIPWLQEFISQCTGCHFDFAQVHYYTGPGTPFSDFSDYVTKFHDAFNLPLWVTEFALAEGAGTQNQTMQFMTQAMDWMDEQVFVERYSWFIAGPNNVPNMVTNWGLTNEDGSLNALGVLYNTH